jgi:hypothetical protein
MDRMTLRTYVNLLEKELTMARASLATLDANEGILAGGHAGFAASSAVAGPRKSVETGPSPNVSSHDVMSGFGTRTAFTGSVATLSTPTNNGARLGTSNSNAGRSYQQHNPNGSPRAQSRELGVQRTGSMINKFTGASSSPVPVNVRSIASVGPQPQQQSSLSQPSSRNSTPGVGSGFVETKMNLMQVSIPGSQPDDINDSAVPSSPASASSTSVLSHSLPRNNNNNNNNNVLTAASPNETRFRMPTNNNNSSSHRPLIVTAGTPSASLIDAAAPSSAATGGGIPLSGSSHLITSHGRAQSGDENTSLLVHQPLSSPLSSSSLAITTGV